VDNPDWAEPAVENRHRTPFCFVQ